jgi:predicted Zn-dependent protease
MLYALAVSSHGRVMNKRLAMLEKLTAAGSADAFGWYGLAMEYRNENRLEDAVSTFEALRERFPDYLAQYLMAGQTLLKQGKADAAASWLRQGIALAQAQGNGKALSELQSALEEALE